VSGAINPIVIDVEKWIVGASLEALPLVLGELERLKGLAWAKMLQANAVPAQTPVLDGQLLTIPQVASRLNIPESRVYELARQHKLHSVRIGKYVRVPISKLAEYERALSCMKK
jgi:excisionase family DNA binding protein